MFVGKDTGLYECIQVLHILYNTFLSDFMLVHTLIDFLLVNTKLI